MQQKLNHTKPLVDKSKQNDKSKVAKKKIESRNSPAMLSEQKRDEWTERYERDQRRDRQERQEYNEATRPQSLLQKPRAITLSNMAYGPLNADYTFHGNSRAVVAETPATVYKAACPEAARKAKEENQAKWKGAPKEQPSLNYVLYIDGGCPDGIGFGIWGAVLKSREGRCEFSGFESRTSMNRMQLTAILEAIKTVPKNSRVTIMVESDYLRTAATRYLVAWKKNGWRNANGQPAKNVDLWEEFDKLSESLAIEWSLVGGVTGIPRHAEHEAAVALAKTHL